MSKISPTTVDVSPIQHKLLARLQRRAMARLVGVICGLPLLFLGPVVLGTMFWVSCLLLYHWYPWIWFFLGTCAVAIPALFVTEIRTAGAFLSEAISPEEASRAEATQGWRIVGGMGSPLALAATIAAPRASAAGFVELFLLGPRLLLGAVNHVRMVRQLRGVDVRSAAMMLYQLRQAPGGVPLSQLTRPGGKDADVMLPLAFLVFYDWVGVATDYSKAWILSEARKDLDE